MLAATCSLFRVLAFFALISIILALPTYDIESRNAEDARFYLYTKSNPSQAQQLLTGNVDSVRNSNFNANRPTKMIIHGWTKSYKQIPNNQLVEAYLARDDYNLISVDWAQIAALNYISSKSKAPAVGIACAEFVKFLVQKFNLDVTRLLIIGHSMGAHIAGFCGKELQRSNLKLGAIVALDAAYPLYTYNNLDSRVAQSDAKFVLSLHTNGQVKGYLQPLGHASFYANNGRQQPGCGTDVDGGCAHARCVLYYAESLKRVKFTPYYQCTDFAEFSTNNACSKQNANVELGDPFETPQISGIFSFSTNQASPYGHA